MSQSWGAQEGGDRTGMWLWPSWVRKAPGRQRFRCLTVHRLKSTAVGLDRRLARGPLFVQWPEGRRWSDKTLGPESLESMCEARDGATLAATPCQVPVFSVFLHHSVLWRSRNSLINSRESVWKIDLQSEAKGVGDDWHMTSFGGLDLSCALPADGHQ